MCIYDKEKYRVIGLMSGTSCDGVDVALLETDGVNHIDLVEGCTFEYDASIKPKVAKVSSDLIKIEEYMELRRDITILHAKYVRDFLNQVHCHSKDIDLIGFHGHSIKHMPEARCTLQMGDGSLLAHETGIDVVSDFRSKDIASGGQGAPLVPVFLRAIVEYNHLDKPSLFLNIGGVSNITYVDDEYCIGYDVGPGNALIDDLVKVKANMNFDSEGHIAMKGNADNNIVNRILEDDFFATKPPKSLDRNYFFVKEVYNMPLEDGVATLSELTVQSICKSIMSLPISPRRVIVHGGGMNNQYFMKRIKELTGIDVMKADDIGLDGNLIEASAFGYLAVRYAKKLPITFPSTTGVHSPETGGSIHYA